MIKIEFGNEQNNNITIYNVRCRAIYAGSGEKSTRITFSSERLLDPERPMINWTTGEIYAEQSPRLISYDRNGSFAKHENYGVYSYSYDNGEGGLETGKIFIGKKRKSPTYKEKRGCFEKRTTITMESKGIKLIEGDAEICFTGKRDGKVVNITVPLCITGNGGKFTVPKETSKIQWKISYSDNVKMMIAR